MRSTARVMNTASNASFRGRLAQPVPSASAHGVSRSHLTAVQRRPDVLYMVVEHFKSGAAPEIYRRARDRGRMMPEVLRTMSPPPGIAQLWNFALLGSKRTSVFGFDPDSLYQMTSLIAEMP